MSTGIVPMIGTLPRIGRTLRIVSWLSLFGAASAVVACCLPRSSVQSPYALLLLGVSVICETFAQQARNSVTRRNTAHMAEQLKQFVLHEPGSSHRDQVTKA